jgi:hypothetical protein
MLYEDESEPQAPAPILEHAEPAAEPLPEHELQQLVASTSLPDPAAGEQDAANAMRSCVAEPLAPAPPIQQQLMSIYSDAPLESSPSMTQTPPASTMEQQSV